MIHVNIYLVIAIVLAYALVVTIVTRWYYSQGDKRFSMLPIDSDREFAIMSWLWPIMLVAFVCLAIVFGIELLCQLYDEWRWARAARRGEKERQKQKTRPSVD